MTLDTIVDEQLDSAHLIEEFFKAFGDYENDRKRITDAWNFLLEKSDTLTRGCGKPYYFHPLRVAEILAKSKMDSDSIICGLLHSIFEIEGVSEDEVKNIFGETVYRIVKQTSKITNMKINSKTIQQADSIRKMLFAMVDDVRVILVKLADRLDRMRNLKSVSEKAQRAVAAEVIDIWAPLADRLGMQSVKSELEDLSLKYTNPDVFQQIKSIVSLKKDERAAYLEKSVNAIYKSAEKMGIHVTIKSRAKHFYSIYQKMRKRNKGADELYDLLALRILCQKPEECYTLIGIVHGLWKPMDGRFKDYISMPKANGYQSIHTTVICEGMPLEIQIRTEEMHNFAEHGVASHWLYKKGTNKDLVDVNSLGIFNQLQELKDSKLDDEEFFTQLKGELLGDEIFVFTPKGDVFQLPAGSNAIDFAYHVHSAVGEKIVGAKADGKIIPLTAPLQNTQIIEILTNPNAHPTESQLKMVKTSKARQRIHAWLLANDPTFVDEAALLQKQRQQEITESVENGTPLRTHSQPRKKRAKNGATEKKDVESNYTGKIKVGNLSNFLVTVAKCCNPKPGDLIAGYVSLGRGVVIHRADCYNYQKIPNSGARTVEVSWEQK